MWKHFVCPCLQGILPCLEQENSTPEISSSFKWTSSSAWGPQSGIKYFIRALLIVIPLKHTNEMEFWHFPGGSGWSRILIFSWSIRKYLYMPTKQQTHSVDLLAKEWTYLLGFGNILAFLILLAMFCAIAANFITIILPRTVQNTIVNGTDWNVNLWGTFENILSKLEWKKRCWSDKKALCCV